MLTQYFDRAMARAEFEALEDGSGYFGQIHGLDGLWATGATPEICGENLRSALEDWVRIGLAHGDRLPIVDGLDLNVHQEVA